MRHYPALILFPLLIMMPVPGAAIEKDPMSISAECRDNKQCAYQGREIIIDVILKNNSRIDIGVPVDFIDAVGPYCTLVDNLTRKEITLRVGLAKPGLIKKFTSVPPGGSIKIEMYIPPDTIEAIRPTMVDLSANLAISAPIKLGMKGEEVKFSGRTSLRIVGEDKLEVEKK